MRTTTRQPRIAITVRGELDETLNKLSKLMNTPKTAIISDILNDTLPALKKVVEAIEEVKQGQEAVALKTVEGFLVDTAAGLNQQSIEFEELKKTYGKPK